jgi:hypothetical protein
METAGTDIRACTISDEMDLMTVLGERTRRA